MSRNRKMFLASSCLLVIVGSTGIGWAQGPAAPTTPPVEGPAPTATTPPPLPTASAPAPVTPPPAARSGVGASVRVSVGPNGHAAPPPAPPPPPPPPKPDPDAPATLIGSSDRITLGGFGGVGAYYSRVAGNNAALVCGEGALLINHAFSVGAGGCGLASEINVRVTTPAGGRDRLHFGYGGFIGRYHFFSREVVNVSLGAMIGAGGLYVGPLDHDFDTDHSSDTMFVFQPEIGVNLNITRWFRAGVTGGYRAVGGVDTDYLTEAKLSGPVAGAHLQFGWF